MLALLGLTPLYPTVAHDLALGPDAFSIYFAIQGGVNLLLQIPVGVIADRVGRRPVMGLGLVFMVAGQLLR
jgi:MFS family permease